MRQLLELDEFLEVALRLDFQTTFALWWHNLVGISSSKNPLLGLESYIYQMQFSIDRDLRDFLVVLERQITME